ncbi:MAG TPA: TonB family protein, partial [Polyangiaceae bacterium]|nr:TonB family protein [Polyangiaceae bacterium]
MCAFAVLGTASAARAQPTEAPVVIDRVDAVTPPEAASLTQPVQVMLAIIVNEDGTVDSPEVVQSAGAAFDDAALSAVKNWHFRPASQNGKPVRSRIRVAFNFSPPSPKDVSQAAAPAASLPAESNASAPATPATPVSEPSASAAAVAEAPAKVAGKSATNAATQGAPETTTTPAPTEITVRGVTDQHAHGASDFQIPVGALRLVPRKNAADFLKLAPGILLTNEGGDGHAEQVFLRGFDAREGQDVEFSVDGVPINDSGNIHGNGYADTHFIIPELIQGLRVTEGPFSPYQGNYAVAGSADYHLGLEARGVTAKATYGSWNTQRLVVLWGPPGESNQTFGAAEAYKTDGFGVSRASKRTSAMGQY